MTHGPILDPLRARLQNPKVGPAMGKTPWFLVVLTLFAVGLSIGSASLVFQLSRTLQAQNKELANRVSALAATVDTIEQEAKERVSQSLQVLETNLAATREEVVGMAHSEVARARMQAESLREQQRQAVRTLNEQIDTKADADRLEQLEKQAELKFEEIGTQISSVQGDVQAGRGKLEETIADLSSLGLRVTEQGKLIAVSEEGLLELRRRGERDYFDFSLDKNLRVSIAAISVELRKTNQKGQHADLDLFVDDKRMQKKKIYTNVPLGFYVGPSRIPYELVINSVTKNQVRGYISVPSGSAPESLELRRRQSSP